MFLHRARPSLCGSQCSSFWQRMQNCLTLQAHGGSLRELSVTEGAVPDTVQAGHKCLVCERCPFASSVDYEEVAQPSDDGYLYPEPASFGGVGSTRIVYEDSVGTRCSNTLTTSSSWWLMRSGRLASQERPAIVVRCSSTFCDFRPGFRRNTNRPVIEPPQNTGDHFREIIPDKK